jgi:hypothetical protein
MQRIQRAGLGLVTAAAVVIGIAVFATTAAAQVTSPGTSSTSGGCLNPSFSVYSYALGFQFFGNEGSSGFSDDEGVCLKQCSDFRKACKKACKASERCFRAALDSYTGAWKRLCKSLEDEGAQDSCFSELESFEDFSDEFIVEDKDIAGEICEEFYFVCSDDCTVL